MATNPPPQQAYSPSEPLANLAPLPIVSKRAPTVNDRAEIGTTWVDTVGQAVYVLVSVTAGVANWTTSPASGSGSFTAVTVNPGNLTVTAGNVSVPLGNLTLGAGNASIAGTLGVGGAASFSGAVTVGGLATLNGGLALTGSFSVTSSGAIAFTSTDNAAGAVSLTANGGTSETILIESVQGTGVAALDLIADVGGVTLHGGLASAHAINLTASNAAGGMTFSAGTAGYSVTAVNGPISLISGTGAINVGADSAAHVITIGNGTGASEVDLLSGSGGISVGGNSVAQPIVVGNITGATSVTVNSGTGGVAVNSTGIGQITLTSSNAFTVDAAAALSLDSSAGAIAIGTDAVAQPINIGTGAAARVITVGNATSTTALHLNSGSGGVAAVSSGVLSLSSTDNVAGAVTLNANGGTSETVLIRSQQGTGATSLNLVSTAGGITLNGGLASASALTLNASNAAGGMVLEAGSAGVSVQSALVKVATASVASAVTIGNNTTGTSVSVETPVDVGLAVTDGSTVANVIVGTGDPSFNAPQGSLYIKTDASTAATRLWVAVDASGTWAFFTASA